MKTGILKLTALLGVLAVASACFATRGVRHRSHPLGADV